MNFVCEEEIADLKDSPVTLIINSTECQGISRANARRVCQPRECEARSPTGDETPIEGVCYSESGDGKRGVHAPSAAREWRSGAEYDVVENAAYGAVYPQKGMAIAILAENAALSSSALPRDAVRKTEQKRFENGRILLD